MSVAALHKAHSVVDLSDDETAPVHLGMEMMPDNATANVDWADLEVDGAIHILAGAGYKVQLQVRGQ